MTSLAEYDANEWKDVVKQIRPNLTDEEFERMWADFQQHKARKQLQ